MVGIAASVWISSSALIRAAYAINLKISGHFTLALKAQVVDSDKGNCESETIEMLQEQQSSQDQSQERRTMRRFHMRLPASVKFPEQTESREIMTETQNVSARGIFFYLDQPVTQGGLIEVTMTFPPNITLTDAVRVRFVARIVRIEQPLPVSRIGVAAVIEEYEFLRPNPDADSSPALDN